MDARSYAMRTIWCSRQILQRGGTTQDKLAERLGIFGLELHETKTRVIQWRELAAYLHKQHKRLPVSHSWVHSRLGQIFNHRPMQFWRVKEELVQRVSRLNLRLFKCT